MGGEGIGQRWEKMTIDYVDKGSSGMMKVVVERFRGRKRRNMSG